MHCCMKELDRDVPGCEVSVYPLDIVISNEYIVACGVTKEDERFEVSFGSQQIDDVSYSLKFLFRRGYGVYWCINVQIDSIDAGRGRGNRQSLSRIVYYILRVYFSFDAVGINTYQG